MAYRDHIGLYQGMYGRKLWFYSGFAKRLVKTAEMEGFQLMRGYSTSRVYRPQLVLLGVEQDTEGFVHEPLMEGVKGFLDGIVNKDTILATNNDVVVANYVKSNDSSIQIFDRGQLAEKNPIRDYISTAGETWVYDDFESLRGASCLSLMGEQMGFSGTGDILIGKRETVVANKLMAKCREDRNKKVVCLMSLWHFVYRNCIAERLEKERVPYGMIVPVSVADPDYVERYDGDVKRAALERL